MLFCKLADGEIDLVATKIGEYNLTLAHLDDLARMLKRMRCRCNIVVDDTGDDMGERTMEKLRSIIQGPQVT